MAQQSFALDETTPVGSGQRPQLGAAPTAQAAPLAPGLSVGAPGVSDADARTMRAITDLASGVLAPKIKEAAQAQYVKGVQEAMTGKALDEIVREKPWYTDIFAPSSALAGARTYTAQKTVAEWGARMQELMPKLAQRNPEDLQAAAVGAMQGFMTGDAQADALITAGITEQMAPLFKQHAKEHYVFVQKQASEAQIGAWESLAKVYQGVAASEASGTSTVSPEDREAAKSRLLGAIVPFADQSDEAFERNVGAFLEGAASGGNFQVVRLFKEAGLYEKLNPEKRATLDRSLKVFARDTLNSAMPKFAVEIATLVNDMTQDPRGIPDKVAALNARAAKMTGVTEQDMIPPQYLDNLIGRVMVAQRNEADARARAAQSAAEKDAEKLGEVSLALGQIGMGPGRVDSCLGVGLCKEHAVESAGAMAYGQAKAPQDKARVLNSRVLKPFDTIKAAFATTLALPEYGGSAGELAQVYEGLTENVKPLYFDERERALMDRFNRQVRAGTPPDQAWVLAKTAPAVQQYMIPEHAKDEASKAIRSVVESENENFLGMNRVDDAGLRILEALTMKAYRADRTNNPPDVAAKRAYAQARANGVDIQGKHVIINHNPADKPLATVVGESTGETATAFEELMAQKAKGLGAELDYYEAIRVPDRGGKAYIQISVTTADGAGKYFTISSDEIKAAVGAKIAARMTKPAAPEFLSGQVIGPAGQSLGPFPRP